MANEAVIREFRENPMDFTVADGTGIEKGVLLKMTDPRTAIISTALGDSLAGIAAREKIASDGRTRLAVYRRGIFDMTCSGAVAVGSSVISYADANYPNTIGTAVGKIFSGAAILGTALETGADAEVIQIDLNLGGGSN